jgi:hypothetical protein
LTEPSEDDDESASSEFARQFIGRPNTFVRWSTILTFSVLLSLPLIAIVPSFRDQPAIAYGVVIVGFLIINWVVGRLAQRVFTWLSRRG